LLLRGGWEQKINRPLTLVVVDEAHNLARGTRGLRLELLLATINRECRYAQFLLLTPFVDNADDIARWLAPDSHEDISLSVEWQPNDLAVLISRPQPSSGRSNFHLELHTIFTNRKTLGRSLLHSETLQLPDERPLGLTWGAVNNNLSKLAAATAHALNSRGPSIVLAGRVSHTWSIARTLQGSSPRQELSGSTRLVQRFLAREFGSDFPLVKLLDYGIGVHHSGLSDEAKMLMEWLLEHEHLNFLVATTTIAQGVNFPVSGVIMASHQYPYGEDMPPEDFWNFAGRAGRVDQESLGVVVLVANDDEREERLRDFVNRRVLALNSTLTAMVQRALLEWGHLELHRLHFLPEWSAFLQYLAHSYRQVGNHEQFALEVEQVLRGTLGFQDLRSQDSMLAGRFIAEVQNYAERIAGKPLSLVDETGFSWESVNATLIRLSEERITEDAWDPDTLFSGSSRSLQRMMGILLDVPELRDNLETATGRRRRNGDLLARMVSDWVNGASLTEMTEQYFSTTADGKRLDPVTAMTECCQNVFGRLTQTASWGLAALQAMTLGHGIERLPEAEQQTLRNLPARVFYGVNSDEAIALRLLGVPRGAAQPLAHEMNQREPHASLQDLRATLVRGDARLWHQALGSSGRDYFSVWNILEGNG
jgi:replicative superfamily II helicase